MQPRRLESQPWKQRSRISTSNSRLTSIFAEMRIACSWSFGEKKDPIGAKAYLDVQDAIKPIYLASRVKYNTTARIDWSQTNKTEVEAEGAFKFFGININAAVDGTYDKAKTAKLELINFAIDEGPLQRMLNE